MGVKQHVFQPARVYNSFGPHPPALRVKPGDRIATPTVDAGNWDHTGEQIPPSMRHTSPDTDLGESNPQVGPFYIAGAEPGDTLVVRILEVNLNRDWAWSTFRPGFGGLVIESWLTGPTGLNDPLPDKSYRWSLDKERMVGRLELVDSQLVAVEIPLRPFLGCIGVAPRFGQTILSMSPGEHGGNMDCPETRAGTTVYLPVFVRGGYLLLGDVHAAQGDGETCGSALETTAEVTIEVGVIKEQSIRWPRFEDDEYIMVAASARPLIDAFRTAHVALAGWLVQDYGFDKLEVLQVLSQVGVARVGNIVDPNYTAVAKYPKRYLP